MSINHAALPPWALIAYLVSGALFILSLRGLSSPITAQRGNRFGMAGMIIAIVTTLLTQAPIPPGDWWPRPGPHDLITLAKVLGAIAIGALIGLTTARRIAMTDMPQLVAAFHSLVGLAAVLVGWAAYLNPAAFGILDGTGLIDPLSRIEMGLGIAIGAITFSGSIIAFAKLNGNMSGAPILLPLRHWINLGILSAIVGLIGWFALNQQSWVIAAVTAAAFLIGFLLIVPIGGADMPVVVSMLNSYSGWAAAAMGFTLHNTAMIITGALVGSSGAILSYIMCKAMNRSFISVIGRRLLQAGRRRNSALGSADQPRMPLSCCRKPSRSLSSPAMAWRWHRPSMCCARWPTGSRRKGCGSNMPSIRSQGGCRGT
jgi:NAD(P) transhydrogenase subunit beta